MDWTTSTNSLRWQKPRIKSLGIILHIANEFHTAAQDRKWVLELVRLVEDFGGGQGARPNSPKVNYHVVKVNRSPCACIYDYAGTNRKLLSWGVSNGPPVVAELMQHFMGRMNLQDLTVSDG